MVGFFARFSFWKEKKNLNNQNTEKRKEQRATLLQVITIYYRNSSAAQLFWLQPWWAERGRKAVKRGHLLCFVSWRTKTQVTLGNDVPLSHLWVFCDHLKYQLSQTHFPLQSFSSLIMSLSNHLPLLPLHKSVLCVCLWVCVPARRFIGTIFLDSLHTS